MPAKSEKQAKFMRAVAHSPSFAKKVGVPQSVGKEFSMKKSSGGSVKPGLKKMMPTEKQMGNMNMAKGSMVGKGLRAGHKAADGIAKKGKTRDLRETMDGGDVVTVGQTKGAGKMMKKYAKGGGVFRSSADGCASRGKTKVKMPAMAKGGKMKGC